MGAADTLCLGMAAVYSFFGITLAVAGKTCWGPESQFCYWSEMDESGEWFGRTLGVWMTLVTTSPYWAGMDKAVLCKVYLPLNVLKTLLFLQVCLISPSTALRLRPQAATPHHAPHLESCTPDLVSGAICLRLRPASRSRAPGLARTRYSRSTSGGHKCQSPSCSSCSASRLLARRRSRRSESSLRMMAAGMASAM
jgi:hypothetical protein